MMLESHAAEQKHVREATKREVIIQIALCPEATHLNFKGKWRWHKTIRDLKISMNYQENKHNHSMLWTQIIGHIAGKTVLYSL